MSKHCTVIVDGKRLRVMLRNPAHRLADAPVMGVRFADSGIRVMRSDPQGGDPRWTPLSDAPQREQRMLPRFLLEGTARVEIDRHEMSVYFEKEGVVAQLRPAIVGIVDEICECQRRLTASSPMAPSGVKTRPTLGLFARS